MVDANGRTAQDAIAVSPGPPAEVHVLVIQEEPLVEPSEPLEDRAPDRQQGTGHPSQLLVVGRERRRQPRTGPTVPANREDRPDQISEERRVVATGLGPRTPPLVHLEGGERRHVPGRVPDERGHLARVQVDVRVDEQQPLGPSRCRALVRGGGEPAIVGVADDAHGLPALGVVEGTVGRPVVHHGRRPNLGQEGVEQRPEPPARIVVHDHGVDVGHRRLMKSGARRGGVGHGIRGNRGPPAGSGRLPPPPGCSRRSPWTRPLRSRRPRGCRSPPGSR